MIKKTQASLLLTLRGILGESSASPTSSSTTTDTKVSLFLPFWNWAHCRNVPRMPSAVARGLHWKETIWACKYKRGWWGVQLGQQLHRTLVAAQWWADTALSFFVVVLAAVHGVHGFPVWHLQLSLHSFVPLPPTPLPPGPVPNKHSHFCGHYAK